MFKIAVIDKFGQSEIVMLPAIPRIGDTIPLFYTPAPRVNRVCFLPEKVMPELSGQNIDAVVTVE
jgi:hypothetical protein